MYQNSYVHPRSANPPEELMASHLDEKKRMWCGMNWTAPDVGALPIRWRLVLEELRGVVMPIDYRELHIGGLVFAMA